MNETLSAKIGVADQVAYTQPSTGCSVVGHLGMVGATLILSNGQQVHVDTFSDYDTGSGFNRQWANRFFGRDQS